MKDNAQGTYLFSMMKSSFPHFFVLITLESDEKGAKSNKKQYLHLLKQVHYTQKSVTVITVLVGVPFKGPFMSFTTLQFHT